MKPVTVEIWDRDPDTTHGFRVVRSFRAGSWGQARKAAKRIMGTVVTTAGCYHRDMGRSQFATMYRHKKQLRGKFTRLRCIEPDFELVPSCGDLGYW